MASAEGEYITVGNERPSDAVDFGSEEEEEEANHLKALQARIPTVRTLSISLPISLCWQRDLPEIPRST